MNDFAFRTNGRLSRPVGNVSSPCVLHRSLSAAELEALAQRIAATDGIAPGQARRQMAQFMGAPSGPKVLAMKEARSLSLRSAACIRCPGKGRLALMER
jgi:hypothetical protein